MFKSADYALNEMQMSILGSELGSCLDRLLVAMETNIYGYKQAEELIAIYLLCFQTSVLTHLLYLSGFEGW